MLRTIDASLRAKGGAGLLCSMPFAGVLPVSIPGSAVEGSLRVDSTALPILGLQVTDSVSRPTLPLSIPSTPALVGMQLECQSLDFAPTLALHLAGSDVILTIVAN